MNLNIARIIAYARLGIYSYLNSSHFWLLCLPGTNSRGKLEQEDSCAIQAVDDIAEVLLAKLLLRAASAVVSVASAHDKATDAVSVNPPSEVVSASSSSSNDKTIETVLDFKKRVAGFVESCGEKDRIDYRLMENHGIKTRRLAFLNLLLSSHKDNYLPSRRRTWSESKLRCLQNYGNMCYQNSVYSSLAFATAASNIWEGLSSEEWKELDSVNKELFSTLILMTCNLDNFASSTAVLPIIDLAVHYAGEMQDACGTMSAGSKTKRDVFLDSNEFFCFIVPLKASSTFRPNRLQNAFFQCKETSQYRFDICSHKTTLSSLQDVLNSKNLAIRGDFCSSSTQQLICLGIMGDWNFAAGAFNHFLKKAYISYPFPPCVSDTSWAAECLVRDLKRIVSQVHDSKETTWLVFGKKLFYEYLKPNDEKSLLRDSSGNPLVDSEILQLTALFEDLCKTHGIAHVLDSGDLFERASPCRTYIISSVDWLQSVFPAPSTPISTVSIPAEIVPQCDGMIGAILCKLMQKYRAAYCQLNAEVMTRAKELFNIAHEYAKPIYAPIRLHENFQVDEVTFQIKSVVMKSNVDRVDHFVAYCVAHNGKTLVRRKVDDIQSALGLEIPIDESGWKAEAGHRIVMVIGVRTSPHFSSECKSTDLPVSKRKCTDAGGGHDKESASSRMQFLAPVDDVKGVVFIPDISASGRKIARFYSAGGDDLTVLEELSHQHSVQRGTRLSSCIALAELSMPDENLFNNFQVTSSSLSGDEHYFSSVEGFTGDLFCVGRDRKLSLWKIGKKKNSLCGFVVLSSLNWSSDNMEIDLDKWMVEVNQTDMIIHNIILATVFEYCRRTLLKYLFSIHKQKMLDFTYSLKLTKNLSKDVDGKTQKPRDYTITGLRNKRHLNDHFRNTSFYRTNGWSISLEDIDEEYKTLLKFPSTHNHRVVFQKGI